MVFIQNGDIVRDLALGIIVIKGIGEEFIFDHAGFVRKLNLRNVPVLSYLL